MSVRYNGDQTDVNDAAFKTVTLTDFTLLNLDADDRMDRMLQVHGRTEDVFDQNDPEVFGFREPRVAACAGIKVGF